MTSVLSGTLAPLVYAGAAICLLLGVSASTRGSTASRGGTLIGAGFLVALVGRVLEVGADAMGTPLALLVLGTAFGVLLADRTEVHSSPASLAWIGALGGAGAALSGLSIALQAADGLGRLAAFAAAGFGALAFAQGAVLAGSQRNTAQASARTALATASAGLAVAALGFSLQNVILLVAGGVSALASVALGRVVARNAGRELTDLAFGEASPVRDGYANVQSCGPEEAAMAIETARNVVIVPGYGMAVAQAQHAVKQLADALEKRGVKVRYAVHPSAGCLPGHMNGVLDEANVPHSALAEFDEANALVASADLVLCVGANDIINPATGDRSSALYGMPTLDVSKARAVFVVKRSLKAGASGAKNPLFEAPQTTMVFGDAKRVTQKLVTVLSGGH
jgi:NAD(P) transhydrogenase subunit beta